MQRLYSIALEPSAPEGKRRFIDSADRIADARRLGRAHARRQPTGTIASIWHNGHAAEKPQMLFLEDVRSA